MKDKILNLSQAARIAECSRDTIRRAAQRQDLPAHMGPGRRGPQWWVREADLMDWLGGRSADGAEHAPQGADAEHSTAGSTGGESPRVAETPFTDSTRISRTITSQPRSSEQHLAERARALELEVKRLREELTLSRRVNGKVMEIVRAARGFLEF